MYACRLFAIDQSLLQPENLKIFFGVVLSVLPVHGSVSSVLKSFFQQGTINAWNSFIPTPSRAQKRGRIELVFWSTFQNKAFGSKHKQNAITYFITSFQNSLIMWMLPFQHQH